MINQQLFDYIKRQTERGVPVELIKQALLHVGWQEIDINETISNINSLTKTNVDSLSKMNKIKKILKRIPVKKILLKLFSLLSLLLVFIIILFSIPLVLGLFKKDTLTAGDITTISLQKVVISEENNAYFNLKKAREVLYFPPKTVTKAGAILLGTITDTAFVEDLISNNKETLKYIAETDSKSNFQYPQLTDTSNISTNVENYLGLYTLEKIYIFYLEKQGKSKEAIEQAFILLSLMKKIENSQVGINAYTLAVTMREDSLKLIREIISNSNFTEEELKQYSEKLNTYQNAEKNYKENLLKVSIGATIKRIDSLKNEEPSNTLRIKDYLFFQFTQLGYHFPYYFEKNRTRTYFIDYITQKIKNSNKLCDNSFSSEDTIMNSIFGFSKQNTFIGLFYTKLYFTENVLGKYFFSNSVESFEKTLETTCKNNNFSSFGVTQILLALKAFNKKTNDLPSTLNELVPNYLSVIPLDPYDGKPLKYSKEKKIIYSIGSSTQDIVGSTDTNLDLMKNPTFKIDF